jgi:hypothetical protein
VALRRCTPPGVADPLWSPLAAQRADGVDLLSRGKGDSRVCSDFSARVEPRRPSQSAQLRSEVHSELGPAFRTCGSPARSGNRRWRLPCIHRNALLRGDGHHCRRGDDGAGLACRDEQGAHGLAVRTCFAFSEGMRIRGCQRCRSGPEAAVGTRVPRKRLSRSASASARAAALVRMN